MVVHVKQQKTEEVAADRQLRLEPYSLLRPLQARGGIDFVQGRSYLQPRERMPRVPLDFFFQFLYPGIGISGFNQEPAESIVNVREVGYLPHDRAEGAARFYEFSPPCKALRRSYAIDDRINAFPRPGREPQRDHSKSAYGLRSRGARSAEHMQALAGTVKAFPAMQQESFMVECDLPELLVYGNFELPACGNMPQSILILADLELAQTQHHEGGSIASIVLDYFAEGACGMGVLVPIVEERAQIEPAFGPRRPGRDSSPIQGDGFRQPVRLARGGCLGRECGEVFGVRLSRKTRERAEQNDQRCGMLRSHEYRLRDEGESGALHERSAPAVVLP